MTRTPILPEDDNDGLLAAEYVMGLLDLPARTAVQTRLRNDPAFVRRVQEWEDHFSALNDDYPEVAAPDLLPAIEARLFPTAPRQSRLATFLTWGAAVAASLAVIIYLAMTPFAPSFTATLVADASDLKFEAVITEGQMTITRVSGAGAPPDKSLELWLIAGDNPPVSLGLLPADTQVISLPGVAPGSILAVSEEQAGGSPDGQPHGPIVASGTLNAA